MLRAGHRQAQNFTNTRGEAIYRYPLPGCAGATINASRVARAAGPHFRAFRRDPEVVFAVRLELRRGSDSVRLPGGVDPPVGSEGFAVQDGQEASKRPSWV